jgi:uncharacterized membrane protein
MLSPDASLPGLLEAAPARRQIELHARCALTRRTAALFVLSIAAVTFAVAAPFAWNGFWPVLAFAALEVALVAWAVRASMRDGAESETIVVTEDSVTIVQRRVRGERSSVFPRHWSRVTLHAPPTALHHNRLVIESHGRACEVGRFLTDDERRSLASRLKQWVGNVNESPAL